MLLRDDCCTVIIPVLYEREACHLVEQSALLQWHRDTHLHCSVVGDGKSSGMCYRMESHFDRVDMVLSLDLVTGNTVPS